MKTSDFDYNLPSELIAQASVKPRDHSRLLAVNRQNGVLEDRRFYEIGDFLRAGDLLVVNESKVFKARLMAKNGIQIFLLRPEGSNWIALAKPGRKISPETLLEFADGHQARVIEKRDDGTILINLEKTSAEVFAWTDSIGQVPVPPYVAETPKDEADYQTVYAKSIGSVAAPTAGFHFTPELIARLKEKGVRFATVTLHVGIGTFRPMKTETVEDHVMHAEWIDVPPETLASIEETKKNGGRVVAIGTTTVRALESNTRQGFTNVFITPGYRFKNVDVLVTNFHLPKSTLLVLVSAFAGRELIMKAYQKAIENKYRFFSFGDAMIIV